MSLDLTVGTTVALNTLSRLKGIETYRLSLVRG